MRYLVRADLAALLLLLGACTGAAMADPSDPFERGRAIYEGKDKWAATARVAGIDAPLSGFACARCHGADAEGRFEGGAYAPSLRLNMLTRSAGSYDAAALAKILAEGEMPNGRALSKAMPRFRFKKPEDVEALLVYLGGISEDQACGFGPLNIKLRVPSAGTDVRASAFVQGLKSALATELPNGVWGLSLSIDETVPEKEAEAPCFAAIGTTAPECAITLFPLEGLIGDEPHYVRGLFATELDQIKALIAHRSSGGVILVGSRPRDRRLADLLAPLLGDDRDPTQLRRWRILSDVEIRPAKSETALILSGADEVPTLVERLKGNPLLLGLSRTLAPWHGTLRRWGFVGQMADPRPSGASADASREGFVAGRLISIIFKQCGGRCTRTRFMELFDRLEVNLENWHNLNYAKFQKSGSDIVYMRSVGNYPRL